MARIGMIEKIENTLGNAVSSYKWIISNFCGLSINTGKCVRSPSFQIASNEEMFPCLIQLYPKGDADHNKDYLILKVFHDRQAQYPLNTDMVQISILNGPSDIISQRNIRNPSFMKNKHCHFNFTGLKNFMDLKNGILDGTLVVQLDLIFDLKTFLQAPKTVNPVPKIIKGDKSKMNDDFEKLLDNEKFSDVKFIVGGKTIYSHKVILSSRSQVFEAMFHHEMTENKGGVVNVTDVTYEVMKELLRYVYASKVNGIEKIAKELLVAADKYSMDDLKTLCEESLFGSLANDNAVQYLIFANSISTFQLQSQVIQFIVDNPDIVEQPEFKTLDSDIMYEVLRAVTRKRVKY